MQNSTDQDHTRLLRHIRVCAIVTAVSSALVACLLLWPIVLRVYNYVIRVLRDNLDLVGTLLILSIVIGLPILISLYPRLQRRKESVESQ